MGPVYEGHIGFNARESVLLEELLPLWNARVEVRVKTWFEARERYWLKIKPVPNVEVSTVNLNTTKHVHILKQRAL